MVLKFAFDGAVTKSVLGTDMGVSVATFIDSELYTDLSVTKFFKGWKNSDEDASSSNVAEWLGCVEAFRLALEYKEPGDVVEIYSDSQVISSCYNGEFQIKKKLFKQYYNEAKELAAKAGLQDLKIKWVKREFNKEADKLSKIALKQGANEREHINS